MESQRVPAVGAKAIARIRHFYPQVKSIIDATEDMTLEVTQYDINRSKRRSHRHCALAVACKRAQQLDGAVAARSVLYCVVGNAAVRYIVPKKAYQELRFFDRGGTFAPGLYELKRPWNLNRLGYKRSGVTKEKGKGTKQTSLRPVEKDMQGLRAVI